MRRAAAILHPNAAALSLGAPLMFISPAYAQAPGAGGVDTALLQFMPFVLIFVVFYFLLLRPQQQRAKQQRQMIDNVKRGDQVVTGGGIIGKVTRAEAGDTTLIVEIAPNVQVKVARQTISDVLTKPVPANNDNRTAAGAKAAASKGAGDGIAARLKQIFKR